METGEQSNSSEEKIKMGGGATNFRPWLFKKGQSGNPSGLPKGTVSLKTWARKYIQELSDEEKLNFMDGLPKDIVWRMAEGQPHQTNETDVKATLKIEFANEFNKNAKPPSETEGSNTI